MTFTADCTGHFKNSVRGIKDLSLVLEIGCYEGKTSNFIIEHLLKPEGKLICVDPLTDNYLNEKLTLKDINDNITKYKQFYNQYERFIENTKHLPPNKLELYRKLSSVVFPELIEKYEGQIDLIYIDGDHRAFAVYNDAVNSFKLCKKDGFIIFDDYPWGNEYGDQAPRFAIDKFLKEYSEKLTLISKNWQVVIQKNKD